jgi:hypothetical protein
MLERFLSTIWRPLGYGEVRAIDSREKKVAQAFFNLEDGYTAALNHIHELRDQGGTDIYFGVIPRMRRRGRSEDVLPATDVLWADLDDKTARGGKPELWARLARFRITPSIYIDSGHGYHAYWLLSDLVPFEEASLAMKAIAQDIGGDHTYDAARVLRVPGTLNYKQSDDVLPVRVVSFSERRYRWSDFATEAEREVRSTMVARAFMPDHPAAQVPDWLADLISNGAPKGARSEACFKVCLWLYRFGYDDAQIADVFRANPDGIGAKYHERKDGDRWLAVTLAAAKARA